MPLSEEENRLLEQMEQALVAEDPKFVSALRGRTLERTARTRALLAAGVFVAGVAMLLGGAIAQQIWLGVLGFLVMLGSATIGLTAWHARHAPQRQAPPPPSHENGEEPRFGVIDGGRSSRRDSRARRSQGRHNTGQNTGQNTGRKNSRNGSFMQRMEHRWERRRQQGF